MARSFNGSSQNCYAASAAASAAPIAMSCWFWADAGISQNGTLVSVCAANPSFQRFELAVISATQKAAVVTNSGGAAEVIETTTTWTAGVWHHAFCVWYSTTSRKAWLNGGGEAASVISKSPSGVAETHIGASRIASPFNHFFGRLAEAAIWAGSGVANMGAADAALLAAGFSPLCLGRWLPNLVLYQDLVRPIDRPGKGPAMTEVGSPGVAAHPRMVYPMGAGFNEFPPHRFAAPYRRLAGATSGGGVTAGGARLAGIVLGTTVPIGEVSS